MAPAGTGVSRPLIRALRRVPLAVALGRQCLVDVGQRITLASQSPRQCHPSYHWAICWGMLTNSNGLPELEGSPKSK